MKTRLIFVRHAEAEGNIKRLFHGWTDGYITEKGKKQAEKVAERLKSFRIDALYSSSLSRALKTAEYISRAKRLPIIRTDKLREINGGAWEGVPWEDLPSRWPEEYDSWENCPHLLKMPDGESMEEFMERLLKEVKRIIENNKGKTVCIVTHGTAIRVLMTHFLGYRQEDMINVPWYDNTSVSIVDWEDGRFKVVLEGDASHLEKELSTISNQDWWIENINKINRRQANGNSEESQTEL